jgi:hypothetical protein
MAHFYGCPECDHVALLRDLREQFPNGWALSTASTTLAEVLECAKAAGLSQKAGDYRIGAWVKPFASFKPGVNPAYAWEPVLFAGGRKRGKDEPTVRDWTACNITLQRGFTGAKPEQFCWWLFDVLGLAADDELIDLFHGSGAVTRAWQSYRTERLFVGRSA